MLDSATKRRALVALRAYVAQCRQKEAVAVEHARVAALRRVAMAWHAHTAAQLAAHCAAADVVIAAHASVLQRHRLAHWFAFWRSRKAAASAERRKAAARQLLLQKAGDVFARRGLL